MQELKDIFGIINWNPATKLDEEKLLSLIFDTKIKNFHYYNKNDDEYYLNGVLEEIIIGEYKGIKFKIWDMRNKILIEFPSNKKVKNTTRIYTKQIINYRDIIINIMLLLMCAITSVLRQNVTDFNQSYIPYSMAFLSIIVAIYLIIKTYKAHKKEKNILEDPKFCKKYYLFSEDPVEARYLVTTAFMERFKNLEKKLDTKRIQCVFYYDKIIFAINSKTNRFELADLYKKVDSPELFKKFFEEFTAIIGMIDYFKLDEKTGL